MLLDSSSGLRTALVSLIIEFADGVASQSQKKKILTSIRFGELQANLFEKYGRRFRVKCYVARTVVVQGRSPHHGGMRIKRSGENQNAGLSAVSVIERDFPMTLMH